MHTFSYVRSGVPVPRFSAVRALLVGTVLGLAAAGCSGGNGDDDGGGDHGAPSRGELVSAPALVRVVEASDLLANVDEALRLALQLQAGSPVCDIALYKIEYATVGGRGEETTGSGALMAPTGTHANCTGARPIVLYAHGTSTDRDYDITNLDAGTENPEGLLVAAFFAAQGYIVIAPNYAGYDVSTLPYHPYLVADQQSADMIDALAAARSALPVAAAARSTDSGALHVTGYSQGGYVAMATHRALEASGEHVTASAPMSGPYALAAFVDAVFAGRVNGGATVQGALLFTAYQQAFGNVYASPDELFEAQYADEIESLFPSDVPRSQLYDQGKLPRDAFFSAEPPAPEYADITPPTSPAEFVPLYERGFATSDFLIRNEYRLGYLQDMQASPDGFWPDTTSAAPPANPSLPLRQALAANDLRDWTPQAPTLLCGGHDDPTVYWLNSEAMQAYWSMHAADAPVSILDVDAAPSGDADPYGDLKRRFGLAKDFLRAQGGSSAVLESYHAGLVPAFCLEAAREFFEQQR